MKLSKQTIEILHWASVIQDDLVIEPGNRIRTISSNKAILFDATVPETFPSEWCLKSLRRVLDYIDDSTELSFSNPTHVELRNGRRTISAPKSDPLLVLKPPKGNIKVKDYEECVFLHSDDVYEIRRLKGEFTVVEFHAPAKGDNIQLDCFAANEDHSLIQTIELVRPNKATQPFRVRIKAPHLKLWEGSFQLDIASAGVARLSWLNGNVVLWIALEAAYSRFGIPKPAVTMT